MSCHGYVHVLQDSWKLGNFDRAVEVTLPRAYVSAKLIYHIFPAHSRYLAVPTPSAVQFSRYFIPECDRS